MIANPEFAIQKYEFTPALSVNDVENHYAKDLWPVVYILSDGDVKEAYVGETTDFFSRMSTHLRTNSKKKLTSVHLISSERFNKSATLDIESNLIKYMSADGQYQLLNGNLGLANHNYYQKLSLYWGIFESIWDALRSEGVTKHSLEFIDNSDLFKYSPYKTLTKDQRDGLLTIIKSLVDDRYSTVMIEGGAGTGKTILAIFLFKILSSQDEDLRYQEFEEDQVQFLHWIEKLRDKFPNPKIALVVPMSSFRNTIKKVFRNVKGLKSSMVIGPAEVVKEKYDILVVDESHRLRQRKNLGAYYGAFDKACELLGLDKYTCSEVDFVQLQSKKALFFYDSAQSIKPSDAPQVVFENLKLQPSTVVNRLKSQFRVKAGNSYVDFVHDLLNANLEDEKVIEFNNYEFYLFDSINDLVSEIQKRDTENGLSRLIAGYSWEWISKKQPDLYDIKIGGTQLRWNSTANDWINSSNAVEEVGCIHTTQGYDLNYAGIIFGEEITYNEETQEIEIIPENYFDKNGKQSIKDPDVLKQYISNIYKTIMLRGIRGTYVYACNPKLRSYLARYIPSHKKSIHPIMDVQVEDLIPNENAIPLYDLKIAAGEFGEVQESESVDWIPLPLGYRSAKNLFACRVVGESMNKVIPNGSTCLFKKYTGGSRNGLIVLAEHRNVQDPDYGSCYTIKEYHSKKAGQGELWHHESIVLRPLSYDEGYEDLILTDDDAIEFKVIGVFEKVLD